MIVVRADISLLLKVINLKMGTSESCLQCCRPSHSVSLIVKEGASYFSNLREF